METNTTYFKKHRKILGIIFLSSLFLVMPLVAKADNVNLAQIPQKWGGYSFYNDGEVYYGSNVYTPQITHVDTGVLHNGETSIRIDGPANVNNSARELNWGGYNNTWSIPVTPGDFVSFSCWIKTGSSTVGQNGNTSRGGIIGIDLFSDTNRVWEYAAGTTTNFTLTTPIFAYYADYTWIPYGSDWTRLSLNLTIPATEFTTDDYGNPFDPSKTINFMIPWITASWQDPSETASVWFSSAELYINPSWLPESNWDNPSVSGHFETITTNEIHQISEQNGESAWANFTYGAITGDFGVLYSMYIDKFECDQIFGSKEFDMAIGFKSNTGEEKFVWARFQKGNRLFGVFGNDVLTVGEQQKGFQQWNQTTQISAQINGNNFTVQYLLNFKGGEAEQFTGNWVVYQESQLFEETPSYVIMTFYVRVSGAQGEFHSYITWNKQDGTNAISVSQELGGYIGLTVEGDQFWLTQLFNTLFTIAAFLLSAGGAIVGLTLIGVLISCIATMSINPLWTFAVTIWDLLVNIASAIAAGASAFGGALTWIAGLFL